MVLGFSAILLPQLEEERTLTADEKSWIASLSNIGIIKKNLMKNVLVKYYFNHLKYTIMVNYFFSN